MKTVVFELSVKFVLADYLAICSSFWVTSISASCYTDHKPQPSPETSSLFVFNVFFFMNTGVEFKDDIAKLFGHVTSQVTNNHVVWDLYAQVHGNCESGDAETQSKVSGFLHPFIPDETCSCITVSTSCHNTESACVYWLMQLIIR